jgi:TatD DNase family protein
MLIDTHAHVWWSSYENDLSEVIERAQKAGVEKMVVPGTNIESSLQAIELAKKYPGIIYPAVGIHPEDVEGADVESVRKVIMEHRALVVAVGEIGIDMYSEKEKQSIEAQKVLFKAQCELAIELDLSVIIHTRDSFTETWEVLSSLPTMPKGQFHCFSVDETALEIVVKAGFYVSFCGNIMYSKRVAKLVSLVPDAQFLLETDSPFMQPGVRNEPSYTRALAEKAAELRGVSLEMIEELTTANAKRLFHL